jgi:hypothetical protein
MITDQQIDAHLESIKPRLRAAIRAAYEQLAPVNFLKVSDIPLPSGQSWQLVLGVMTEPMAELLAHTAMAGAPAMLASYGKMQQAPSPTPSDSLIPGL